MRFSIRFAVILLLSWLFSCQDNSIKPAKCLISSILMVHPSGSDLLNFYYGSDGKLIFMTNTYQDSIYFTYDSRFNIIKTESRFDTVVCSYDAHNRLLEAELNFDSETNSKLRYQFEYNPYGQLIKRQSYFLDGITKQLDKLGYWIYEYPNTQTHNPSVKKRYSRYGNLSESYKYEFDNKNGPFGSSPELLLYFNVKGYEYFSNNVTKKTDQLYDFTENHSYSYNEKGFPTAEETYPSNSPSYETYTYNCK